MSSHLSNSQPESQPTFSEGLRQVIRSVLTPDGRRYLKPVAWLGGRDLLANLKYFLLFAAFKGKLDPRDFMSGRVFPSGDDETRVKWEATQNEGGEKEFWFDYFADSGDGMTAGYAVAYMCLSDLYARLPAGWNRLTPAERTKLIKENHDLGEIRSRLAECLIRGKDGQKVIKGILRDYSPNIASALVDAQDITEAIGILDQMPGMVSVRKPDAAATGWQTLPRGSFLFVGGDTAYHVADFAGLGLRFQKMFDWAFEDLTNGMTPDETKALWIEPNRRPVFGVPGNHDYYDMIDGFNRQFGRPITRETNFINLAGKDMPPHLRLWTFKRFQTASYVAIKMPFDWWFWGVDSELPTVDVRQQEFFKRSYSLNDRAAALKEAREILQKEKGDDFSEDLLKEFPRISREDDGDRWPIPRKLIVATSEPTTVEGRCKPEDDKTCRAFSFLGLKRPFLYGPGNRPVDPKIKKNEAPLVDFQCRLDISGDVHHYARYWGDEDSPHYASVVSGGGGASMSPTQTDYGEITEQAVYPAKNTSTRIINRQLFKPWVVIRGGNVWLAGLIIAVILYLGASVPAAHYAFTSSVITAAQTWAWSSIAWPAGTAQVFKLTALLVLSIGSLVGAGLYARWLFTRLTDTYDWANDRKNNLQFKTTANVAQAQLDADRKTYQKFLDDISKQVNVGVSLKRCLGFAVLALASLFAAALFWAFEFTSYGPFDFSSVPWIGKYVTILATWLASTTIASYFATSSPTVYGLTFFLLFLIAAAIIIVNVVVSFKKSKSACAVLADATKLSAKDAITKVKQYTVTPSWDYLPYWGLLVAGVGSFSLVIFEYKRNSKFGTLPLFGNSVLVFLTILAAIAAAIAAMYYSKWLFDQSYRLKVNLYSYVPATTLSIISVALFVLALAVFGREEGRAMVFDVVYLLALVGVPVGCIALAVFSGNHKRNFIRTIWFLLLGLWHGILQLVVPFQLVWLGNRSALFWTIVVVGVMTLLPMLILHFIRLKWLDDSRTNRIVLKTVLTLVWAAYGAIILALPWWLHRQAPGLLVISRHPRLSVISSFVLVGLLGALMSCVWLGWYFAVSLVFNGHANEAGSTARTEEYKHFIRFRLTNDTLTGYVIAVDFPHAPKRIPSLPTRLASFVKNGFSSYMPPYGYDGKDLKPRLVDVFTLTCRTK